MTGSRVWLDYDGTSVVVDTGLHLADRLRKPEPPSAVMSKVLRFATDAESTADYTTTREIEPAVTFGYGVLDVAEITTALIALRRALEK